MSGHRILVVDDEPPIRQCLGLYLQRLGYRVDLASDGAEAIARIEGSPADAYDLIVSDIRMPGLDGQQLWQRLRARGDRSEQRLLLITGDTAGEDTDEFLLRTGAPVLLKPFDLPQVARAIEFQMCSL